MFRDKTNLMVQILASLFEKEANMANVLFVQPKVLTAAICCFVSGMIFIAGSAAEGM